jgi:hypothetical protein
VEGAQEADTTPDLRPEFESWLGFTNERARLAVRFDRGSKLSYSLRRPIGDVIAATSP